MVFTSEKTRQMSSSMKVLAVWMGLLWSQIALAQIELSHTALNFGEVQVDSASTMVLTISNKDQTARTLITALSFDSCIRMGSLPGSIGPGQSTELSITFAPEHNLLYDDELLLLFDNGQEFSIDTKGKAVYEDSYYDLTFNKSHQELKAALKTIVSANYTSLGYNVARDHMYGSLDNASGKVTCVYTGRQANFNTRSGANSNNFNCEHTWPQSLFSSNEPEKSDIHHLFPTDVDANSKRGNAPFGVVMTPTWSVGGSKLGGGYFEPRDDQKGATARAMLYFVIRYQDYGNFIGQQETVLKSWHLNHLPSGDEINRNHGIYQLQKNRNPFVDHPEFAKRIHRFAGEDTLPQNEAISFIQEARDYGNISTGKKFDIFLVNTGNVDLESYADVSCKYAKTALTLGAVQTGNAQRIELSFDHLVLGTYRDTLTLDLSSIGKGKQRIPINYTISTVGLNDLWSENQIYWTGNTLYIRNTQIKVESASFYSTSGRLVQFNELNSNFGEIPLAVTQPGIYFAVIKTGQRHKVVRCLVN